MVVLDDPGNDGSRPVRQAIRSAGAKLCFVPFYALDLNPIEQAFAKIQPWMGDAQQRRVRFKPKEGYALVHTIEALCAAPVAAIRQ